MYIITVGFLVVQAENNAIMKQNNTAKMSIKFDIRNINSPLYFNNIIIIN